MINAYMFTHLQVYLLFGDVVKDFGSPEADR